MFQYGINNSVSLIIPTDDSVIVGLLVPYKTINCSPPHPAKLQKMKGRGREKMSNDSLGIRESLVLGRGRERGGERKKEDWE